MHITHLSLTNFRNFTRLTLDVPSGSILLIGHNAQGKTNLLEAIYFLATFSSFQTRSDRQLINFLSSREPLAVGRIIADFQRGTKTKRIEVRIIKEDNKLNNGPRTRKEVLLDGTKRKLNQSFGQFNAVLFLPQMLRVIEGPPKERRRYLDLALSQTIPDYALALNAYNRFLSQRNALLKQLFERGGDTAQLAYWDEKLALAGGIIIFHRIHALHELEELASYIHHDLTREMEVLRLYYQPSFDPYEGPVDQYTLPVDTQVDRTRFSKEQISASFHQKLDRLHDEEISRRQTTIGPHRDELRFLSNGVDLGTYGSRGQARTTLLSLKLAEVSWMKKRTGDSPVLLFDEVLAELDPQRRNDLLSRLGQNEQVILTGTDLNVFTPDFIQKSNIWNIKQGRVHFQDSTPNPD